MKEFRYGDGQEKYIGYSIGFMVQLRLDRKRKNGVRDNSFISKIWSFVLDNIWNIDVYLKFYSVNITRLYQYRRQSELKLKYGIASDAFRDYSVD